MALVQIEVPEIDPAAFNERIIRACVDRILGGAYGSIGIDDEEREHYGTQPETEFSKTLRKEIIASLKGRLDAELSTTIGTILDQPIRKTNTWGEPDPTDKGTTLRAYVRDSAEKWLSEQVNPYDGKTVTGYNSGREPTRAQYFVNKAVQAAFTDGLDARVKAMVEEVKAGINAKLTDGIATAVKNLLGVRA